MASVSARSIPSPARCGLAAGSATEATAAFDVTCTSRDTDDVVALKPMRLFHWSNMYLTLLFLAVAIDPLLKR